jgi:plasmid stabilization system protein ParE
LRVVFTPRAERQIDSLYDDIAIRTSEATADAYIGRIVVFDEKKR